MINFSITNFFQKIEPIIFFFRRYAILFAILGVVILFLPSPIAASMQINLFRQQFGIYIGVLTIFFILIPLFQFSIWGFGMIKNKLEKSNQEQKVLKELVFLSKKEAEYLLCCVLKKQNTFATFHNDSTAITLCEKGVIVPASQGDALEYPYIINSFVLDHLKEHYDEFFNDKFDSKELKLLEQKYEK